MDTLTKQMRKAGLLYLLMAGTSGFGLMYFQNSVFVAGDAVATVNNIVAKGWMVPFAMLVELAGQVVFLFLALALYNLFKPVDKRMSVQLVLLVAASVPFTFAVTLFQVGAIIASLNPSFLSTLHLSAGVSLAMLCAEIYRRGIMLAGIFWGLWLLPFGMLTVRSGFIPKVIGILLLAGGIAYLIDSVAYFLVPDVYTTVNAILILPMSTGEFVAIFWLLFRGLRGGNGRSRRQGTLNNKGV